jgi:hypothetical protein
MQRLQSFENFILENYNKPKGRKSSCKGSKKKDLEEGWNLTDKNYMNVVRSENYKRRKVDQYIPNTSAIFPKKGDS